MLQKLQPREYNSQVRQELNKIVQILNSKSNISHSKPVCKRFRSMDYDIKFSKIK